MSTTTRTVLRIGVVAAPAASTFFVRMNGKGEPEGVTVTLGRQLAEHLGATAQLMPFRNSGELTDALEAGLVDVGFMPVDDERRERVAFGPAYFLIESTAMARGDAGFESVADLDRPGVRVVGIANTTTIRSAQRGLPQATVTATACVEEALNQLRSGRADAVVLSRDVLDAYSKEMPGYRVMAGRLQATGVAIAVPRGRSAELAAASRFLEEAKANGSVRAAFDAAGFATAVVASCEN